MRPSTPPGADVRGGAFGCSPARRIAVRPEFCAPRKPSVGRNNCGRRRSDRAESGRIAPRRERGPQSPIVRRLTACGSGRIRCPADGKIGILRTAQATGEISQFERPIAGVALRGNVCKQGRRAPPMIVIVAGEFLAFGYRGHRRMAAQERSALLSAETAMGGLFQCILVDRAINDAVVVTVIHIMRSVSRVAVQIAQAVLVGYVGSAVVASKILIGGEDPKAQKRIQREIVAVEILIAVPTIGCVGRHGRRQRKILITGRHRKPTDIPIGFAPRHPARSPNIARHPEPAEIRIVSPPSVMIDDVAIGLVRHPKPSVIAGVLPITVEIRAEVSSGIWLPDIAPNRMTKPPPERRKLLLKIGETDLFHGRTLCCGRCRLRRGGGERNCRECQQDRCAAQARGQDRHHRSDAARVNGARGVRNMGRHYGIKTSCSEPWRLPRIATRSPRRSRIGCLG